MALSALPSFITPIAQAHRLRSYRCPRPVGRQRQALLALTTLALAAMASAAPASAQEARPATFAIDTVAAVDETVTSTGEATTGMTLDAVLSANLSRGFEAIVRPFAQRLTSGEWNRQVWMATVRYERQGRIGIRVDGGLIPSPIGYANLLLRPHLNPTVALPTSLFTPLPSIEQNAPRTTLLGPVYPLGVSVTASTQRWDARAAVIDVSPLRPRRVFSSANPPRFATLVVGGGVTPRVGLRVGASVARTGWIRAGEAASPAADRNATMITVEGEYAAGYTKLAGEWTRDLLETSRGTDAADGWFVQGQQTLTPRWFAAARVERIAAPALMPLGGTTDVSFMGTEEVLGFRLTPDLTLRAGHRARRTFGASGYAHAATMSVVWWRRWM